MVADIATWITQYGRRLVPCAGKAPAVPGWASPDYRPDVDALRAHAAAGGAVGWVLSAYDLIIDSDPRNGGEASLLALAREYREREGVPMSSRHPIVETGGGGWHAYGRLPAEVAEAPGVRWQAELSPGLEVKRQGHQVIIPGSPHPSGHAYTYRHNAAPDAAVLPLWPAWLVARARVSGAALPSSEAVPSPGWSAEVLAGWLRQLTPENYREYASWRELLMAAHHATAGSADGCRAFVAWSTTDPQYADAAGKIAAMWASLDASRDGGVTHATLCGAVFAAGGADPEADVADLDSLDELPAGATLGVFARGAARVAAASAAIAAIDPRAASDDALAPALRAIARLRTLERDAAIDALSKRTHVRRAVLRAEVERLIAGETQRELDDAALAVCQRIEAQPGRLMVEANGRCWRWPDGGPHWREMQPAVLAGVIMAATMAHAQETGYDGALSALAQQTDVVLRARRVQDVGIYEEGQRAACSEHRVLIPTRTATVAVHGDGDGRMLEAVLPEPEHYQTAAVNAVYDPAATAPVFSRSLLEIFRGDADTVRHLWEVIGYSIQPRKDLPSWVLLVGSGANGKSVVLDVLSGLLGGRASGLSLHELDVTRDSHAMADLAGKYVVIDDDLDTSRPLPDAQIKRLSENKMMTANPKYRGRFEFENTAICWAAANAMPRSADASEGLLRRAHVIKFERTFAPSEQDIGLSAYVRRHELSGVLTLALQGLTRLRKRGRWQMPESVVQAINEWRSGASPFLAWFAERVAPRVGGRLEVSAAYDDFRQWCGRCGVSKPLARYAFAGQMASRAKGVIDGEALGYELRDAAPAKELDGIGDW